MTCVCVCVDHIAWVTAAGMPRAACRLTLSQVPAHTQTHTHTDTEWAKNYSEDEFYIITVSLDSLWPIQYERQDEKL